MFDSFYMSHLHKLKIEEEDLVNHIHYFVCIQE